MSHFAFIGGTGSGKTTMARWQCARLHAKLTVGVLDPYGHDWECDFRTDDVEVFLRWLEWAAGRRRKVAGFVDESSQALDRFDLRMDFLTTGARNAGIESYLLAQSDMQLSPNLRRNIGTWYFFQCDDAVSIAKRRCNPIIAQAKDFRPGEFLLIRRFKPPLKGQIIERAPREILRVDLKSAA